MMLNIKLLSRSNGLFLLLLFLVSACHGQAHKAVKDLSAFLLHSVDTYGPTSATLTRYNELRELQQQSCASTIEEIDFNWLRQVKEESVSFDEESNSQFLEECWAEYMVTGGSYLPAQLKTVTQSQRDLINEGCRALGIQEHILMLAGRSWAICSPDDRSSPSILSIIDTDNINRARFDTYHELSHILFRHHRMRIDAGTHKSFASYLQKDEFKKIHEQAAYYVDLAKKHLDESTVVGKTLKDKTIDNPPFWVPPTDPDVYNENLFRITLETQADLNALEKLFEQNHLDAILYTIERYSKFKVTDHGPKSHPSYIEMSLYACGFLIDKGLDINQLLHSWELQK